jgi:hypothetical protein
MARRYSQGVKEIARGVSLPDGLICTACGLEVAVLDGRLFADDAGELAHAFWHLGIKRGVERVASSDEVGEWVLWRIDDPGNRYDVGRFRREASARCFAAELEARVHKQMYGVEQRPTPVTSRDEPWALVRQDDGGMRYEMRRSRSRDGLDALAALYNREGRHKQVYFVEGLTTGAGTPGRTR